MEAVNRESSEDFISGLEITKPGSNMRYCLRDPIPEIYEAAFLLDEAVVAHVSGKRTLVIELFKRTNTAVIQDWTESLWGKNSPYVKYRIVSGAPTAIPEEQRIEVRMPTREQGFAKARRIPLPILWDSSDPKRGTRTFACEVFQGLALGKIK